MTDRWAITLIASSWFTILVGLIAAREIDQAFWNWRRRRRAGKRGGWL